jgi:hypothetical protein
MLTAAGQQISSKMAGSGCQVCVPADAGCVRGAQQPRGRPGSSCPGDLQQHPAGKPACAYVRPSRCLTAPRPTMLLVFWLHSWSDCCTELRK